MSTDPLRYSVRFRCPFEHHPEAPWTTLAKFLNEGEAMLWAQAKLREEAALVNVGRLTERDAYFWARVCQGNKTLMEWHRKDI